MKYALNDKYPIETKDQLIKAAEYFDKNLQRFHPDERVKIACSLDERSAELKVNIDKPWIINYTRMEKSASLSPDFKSAMKMRKEACVRHNIKIPEIKETGKKTEALVLLDEITKMASTCSSKSLLNIVKEFDKVAGIEYLYDNEIVDPYLTVFGSLNNPEFDAEKLAGDSTQYDLVRASRDQEKLASIKEKLGDKFASEFHENPIMSLKKLGSPEKTVLSSITG